jgi:NADH-quinone oxidoreductase subunit C
MSENLPHRAAATTPMQAEPWEGELPSRLLAAVPEGVIACLTYLGQHFVDVRSDAVLRVLAFLRDTEQFDFLTDLTAVDRARDPGRFEIIYFLYSFANNQRLRVKTHVSLDQEPASITSLFPAADWLEREVFDMFGIRFAGHPDLKRILLPDEWQGFPLRKDTSILAMDQGWVRDNLHIESGQ